MCATDSEHSRNLRSEGRADNTGINIYALILCNSGAVFTAGPQADMQAAIQLDGVKSAGGGVGLDFGHMMDVIALPAGHAVAVAQQSVKSSLKAA